MFIEIIIRILLFFAYASCATFIPVIMDTSQMWYIGSAEFIRSIILSIKIFKSPDSRFLEFLFQISNYLAVGVSYHFTSVYIRVYMKETTHVFSYIYCIMQFAVLIINSFYVSLLKNNVIKVHPIDDGKQLKITIS